MKAAIYPGQGKPIVIEDLPDPQPGADDIIIKVHRCGICGTDLSMTKGELWDFGAGRQFGHEYSGEIVALGKNVSTFAMGDKITTMPSAGCGHCAGCDHGNPPLCSGSTSAMHGFAEYARIPCRAAVKLPSALSLVDGALIEPMAVSLYGIRQSHIAPGDRVLVLGGGTVALYAIYWARRLGAGRIAAMSRSPRRKDLCLQMGADAFIQYGDNELGEVIEALGGKPDIIYECVGSAGMLAKSVQHAKLYGKIISLGFCTSPDPIMPAMAAFKCATMQFIVGYTMQEFLYAAEQMDKGHVDPKTLITSSIPLLELPAMMETLRGSNAETKIHVMPFGA